MFLHKYKVVFWDQCAQSKVDESGIVFGESFCEAVQHLEHYYGADNIIKVELEGFDFGEYYVVSNSSLREVGYSS